MTAGGNTPRVVIVGGGFGGLRAAGGLKNAPVRVTLIDRKNHHTFQPLLYQVATAGLSPGDITAPIRWILRSYKNTEVLLGDVMDIDPERRVVRMTDMEIPYDYLIVASGAQDSYFGHNDWEKVAPGLKTIEDAIEIRRRVLLAFELAERRAVMGGEQVPLTFAVVGAGPTGVELAGTLAEISRQVLADDFRAIDPKRTRIILIEGGPRVLPAYPEDLSRSAEEQLRHLGVEVMTAAKVTGLQEAAVMVGEAHIPALVILWAAGVSASPLGKKTGGPVDRAGRVLVEPDLSVPGHPEIFVIGDLAALKDQHGKWLPGLAPVAMQEGTAVARSIRRDLEREPRQPFHYFDKGTMATIGRKAAVAQFGRLHISGFLAWLSWLFVHILFLIGFRNRLLVLIQWAWSYLTFQKSARLITGANTLDSWTALRDHETRNSKAGD
jgi:NADH dehydrogenase